MQGSISARAGGDFSTAKQRADAIISTLENSMGRHMAVMSSADKLEWHERGSTGNNIIKELIEYCDTKAMLVILGSELSTTSGNIGSYAQTEKHDDKLLWIVDYRTTRLAETLVRDLLFDMVIRNQENLKKLGAIIPQKGELAIRFTTPSQEDSEENENPYQ